MEKILLLLNLYPILLWTQSTPQTLKLLFAGDIMGHQAQIESAEVVKDKIYDYTKCFGYIKPIIQKADLAFGNLELTLPGKPPYRGYPLFRSPDALSKALQTTGFDVLLTANNHSNDAGGSGLSATIKTLSKQGFFQTGTFLDASDRAVFYPLLIYEKGFKIALLNYTFSTNQIETTPPHVVNRIDKTQIKADLAEAHRLQPDYVIVFLHWGREYELNAHKRQRRYAKLMAEWGADMVIGAHPHVIQPIENIEVIRNGRPHQCVVAYSLGNFISDQQPLLTKGGLLLEVELIKASNQKRASINHLNHSFVWTYKHEYGAKNGTYLVLPISLFEKSRPAWITNKEYENMSEFVQQMRLHIGNVVSQEKHFNNKNNTTQPQIGKLQTVDR